MSTTSANNAANSGVADEMVFGDAPRVPFVPLQGTGTGGGTLPHVSPSGGSDTTPLTQDQGGHTTTSVGNGHRVATGGDTHTSRRSRAVPATGGFNPSQRAAAGAAAAMQIQAPMCTPACMRDYAPVGHLTSELVSNSCSSISDLGLMHAILDEHGLPKFNEEGKPSRAFYGAAQLISEYIYANSASNKIVDTRKFEVGEITIDMGVVIEVIKRYGTLRQGSRTLASIQVACHKYNVQYPDSYVRARAESIPCSVHEAVYLFDGGNGAHGFPGSLRQYYAKRAKKALDGSKGFFTSHADAEEDGEDGGVNGD